MKRYFRVILVALVTLLPFARTALGQRTYAFGLGGGAAIPVGKLGDIHNTGYNGMIALAIGVAELPIGVRFDGIYSNLLNNKLVYPAGSGVVSSDLRVMGALGNLIFAFSGTSAKPYVIIGGGIYNTKPDVPGAEYDTNLGFNAGLGATFRFGPLATFLESRYHTISRDAANGGAMQFVPITVGLLF